MEFKDSVQPPLRPLAPRFSRALCRLLRLLSPFYMRLVMKIRQINTLHMERIVDQYRRFQDGKTRLIIAFRHPSLNDPALMFIFLSRWVRRAARRQGGKLKRQPHAWFIYDRGVPLWLGSYGNWLLPGVGAISLFRGKLDAVGLRAIRSALQAGVEPVCLAPEGATTFHADSVGRLNPGVAHFAFWCAADLRKAGRDEEVVVLPVSLKYRHIDPRQKWFVTLLKRCESECFTAADVFQGKRITRTEAFGRIGRLLGHLVTEAEDYYARFFRQSHLPLNRGKPLQERIDAVTDAALATAETFLGIRPAGDRIERQHANEQAAWDLIFRNDIEEIDALSPYRKAMADRVAAGARLFTQHNQLADVLMYARADYLGTTADGDRFIETLSICEGILARFKGGNVASTTPRPLADVDIVIGRPLSVSARLAEYVADRRKTTAAFLAELNDEYVRLIDEHPAADHGWLP